MKGREENAGKSEGQRVLDHTGMCGQPAERRLFRQAVQPLSGQRADLQRPDGLPAENGGPTPTAEGFGPMAGSISAWAGMVLAFTVI